MESKIFIALLLVYVVNSACSALLTMMPNILGPALANRPFVVTWNVASQRCEENFGVKLDLGDFDIVHNPDKSWKGSTLTIFYTDQIGLHPYFDEDGKPQHGGLPQLGNMYAHLDKVTKDVLNSIPQKDFQGLAVIDWENWLPLFDKMTFGKYLIYRTKSIEKVQQEHPTWTYQEQVKQAKWEYDTAAKNFMDDTLDLVKILRPKALWGYYLYPDCYNYDKNGTKTDLTCSNNTMVQNDEIQWVFDDSTALYPSVYLGRWFKDNRTAIAFVANRVKEAMRVDSRRPGDISIPVFVYHMLNYRSEVKFLDSIDLRHSIGVSSVLGASGMVLWGDYNLADSVESCQKLSDYINFTLGPFCKKTSDAAAECSNRYCSSHGRCVITHGNKTEKELDGQSQRRYLTVDEAIKLVQSSPNSAYELFDVEYLKNMYFGQYSIACQCFSDWGGNFCQFPRRN